MKINDVLTESPQLCPECGGVSFSDLILAEKKDACYYKVKASAKVWPSAYASGRLVQCRKKGAANWGNSKNEGVEEGLNEFDAQGFQQRYTLYKDGYEIEKFGDIDDAIEYAEDDRRDGDDSSAVYKIVDINKQVVWDSDPYEKPSRIQLRKPDQGVAEGLNEFAPAGGGMPPRGPRTPGGDPWGGDDSGEDPYGTPKPRHYARSSSYFEQFEADHFDDEVFDAKTGVFKGYWDDEEGRVQIAYFKFDDPTQTSGDDPGMGWYYEPQNEGVAEVSRDTLKSYQQKVSADSMKHSADPTKRSQQKANRSVAGFAKAQNRLEQGVAEGSEDNPVASAIYRRLMHQKPDLFTRYGLEVVAQAVEDVADSVGHLEPDDEIGSSDVSGWVRRVEQNLSGAGMAEGSLSEVDRRGFLRALGGAALGAAGVGAASQAQARVTQGADGQMSPSFAQQMAQQVQASPGKSGGQMPNQNIDTAEKVERRDNGIIVHYGGKEYKGVLVPKDGPTPRGAKMIKITQAQMGERGIGNYTTYLLPNGTAHIYILPSRMEETHRPGHRASSPKNTNDLIGGRYDPDEFDQMVLRLKQMAQKQERERGPVDLKDLARRLRGADNA